MVSFTLCTLATLALSACVAAIPDAAPSGNSTATFTFSEWIEGIIANPEGEHLTPLEAVEAKNVAIEGDSPLSKRYNCDQTWGRANATDAASCLQTLASLGAQGQNCTIGDSVYSVQLCTIGNSQVVGSKSASAAESTNCDDVARTGGLIFDSCWRSDGTVMGSEICITNSLYQVNILGL